MLCFGFSVWPSPPSCVCTAWCGTQSTTATGRRRTQNATMAPTARKSPGLMRKVQKVLKTAHPSTQATTRATLPEEGIGIPSRKSPTDLERNEGAWFTRTSRRVPRTGRVDRWCGPPCAEGKQVVPSGRAQGPGVITGQRESCFPQTWSRPAGPRLGSFANVGSRPALALGMRSLVGAQSSAGRDGPGTRLSRPQRAWVSCGCGSSTHLPSNVQAGDGFLLLGTCLSHPADWFRVRLLFCLVLSSCFFGFK